MKRNFDVLRKIMLALEAIPNEGGQLDSDALASVDNDTAFYHMRLLIEAGLAIGSCPEMLGRCHGCLYRLTWAGHELLDQIRRDTTWNRIKEIAKTKGLELTVDAVKAIAKHLINGLLP